MKMKFKLIKGGKFQSVNPGYNDDYFVVDVACLDSIVDFKSGSIQHLPGTTASQLNQYLDSIHPGYKLPLSLELTDPLLIYNQKNYNIKDTSLALEYGLNEHQMDNRWLIVGFDSLEALYNLHDEIMLLKKELGGLALSIFYMNRDALIASHGKLKRHKVLNSKNFMESRTLKNYPWFLFIEIPYNKHIAPSIKSMINERLGGFIYWRDSFLRCFKMYFNKEDDSSNSLTSNNDTLEYCETINITIKNDVNLLLFAYHSIYLANLSINFKPHIFIDILSNEQIKLSVKIYYKSSTAKQAALNYALSVINRIKLKA